MQQRTTRTSLSTQEQQEQLYPHTLTYFHGTYFHGTLHILESHIWSKQMWGQRSSRGQWPLVQVFEKSHCIHILWCIFMGRGYNDPWVESHMWPQQKWVKGHLWVTELLVKFLKNSHCIHILWCITMGVGLILQWLQKYVITKAGETRGSRTGLLTTLFYFLFDWF